MNKARRKQLGAMMDRIEAFKTSLANLVEVRDAIASELETLRDEEQEAFDNMPEGMQDGERGQTLTDNVDALTSALDTLEGIDMDVDLDEVQSQIDEARGIG